MEMGMNKYYNCDCMEYMATVPDKFFNLAIVDPEYGINAGQMTMGKGKASRVKKSDWDSKPPDDIYFKELFRISKNQIIFGGNYFNLHPTNSWIVWDKDRQKEVSFSDGELLWTSFKFNLKIKKHKYDGFLGADKDCRIHKCQKPIDFYRWLLQNYAKPGDTIFDSHVGSGSSIIACIEEGFEYVGCELDQEYYELSSKRIQEYIEQGKLF